MSKRTKRMRDFNSYSLAFVVCVGVDKEAIS
jgi:hypothetical protein